MRKALLAFLLAAVPLLVDPWAVTFDASKAALLAAGALVLASMALPKRTETGPGRFDLRWSPVSAILGAALLVLAASAWRGPDPWAAARLLALLLAAGTFALAVENAVFIAGEMEPLLRAVAWTQGIVAGYGLLQAAGIDLPFSWNEGRRPVPASSIGNPNWAAEWCAAALPLSILVAFRTRGRGRGACVLGLLLGAAFLCAARGRAALLGLAAGAAVAGALLLFAAGGPRRAAGIALSVALLAGLGVGGAVVLARGGDLPGWMGRSDTVVVRADLARGTARMLLDHPLGVGAGNWEAAHPPYRTEREYRASLFRDPGEAHDDPLQFAAEGGWPFVAAMLALVAVLAAAAFRAVGPGGDRGLAAALAASLAATAAASLASAPFHRPASLLLAAFAAGGLAFLGGGRVTTLGTAGAWAHRLVVLLLGASVILLGQRAVAEGPQAEARRIEREADPLPRGRAAAARDLFVSATALDPGAADALARAGELSLKIGASEPAEATGEEFPAARKRFESLLGLRPSDPMALSNLANALAASGSTMEAEATWRRALEVAPWHRNANQAFAFFLLRQKRPAEALPLVERALDVDPAYAPAIGTRAEALVALGRDGDALAAASDGIDRLLAARDLQGAGEASRRAAAASPALAAMLVGKAARLLAGPDREGGRAVVFAAIAGRPGDEDLLEKGAQALSAGKYAPEAARLRVDARFAAAEAALAAGDRERAAAETRRGLEVTVSTEEMRRNRFLAASLFIRAGRREEALAALGVAASRGFADAGLLERDPAFAPLRDDPAFRGLLGRVRRNAEK
jgi:tetratricopeptide (TPR) repeat protein